MSAPTASTSGLSAANFDCRSRAAVQQRTAELTAANEAWIEGQPEVREVLADFMQSLLIHKPDDALAFMRSYFKDIRATAGGGQAAEE